MAHDHILRAFRWAGGYTFKSNVQKIWVVLAFLSLVTGIEVILGIYKPAWMMKPLISKFSEDSILSFFNGLLSPLNSLKFLNLIFIILTLVKAYYITWDFMHMRDEKTGLRRAVVWTAIFLVSYLIFILLLEADYVFTVFKEGFMTWNF